MPTKANKRIDGRRNNFQAVKAANLATIRAYFQEHPYDTNIDCALATGFSAMTVGRHRQTLRREDFEKLHPVLAAKLAAKDFKETTTSALKG